MKLAILTFYNAYNYGAVLQAYGLQKFLEDMGYDVEILNYKNNKVENSHNYFSIKYNSILVVLYRLIFLYNQIKKKKYNFKSFVSTYLKLSKKEYMYNDISSDYDIYIIGSDQIWNPFITGGLDPFYWGKSLYNGRIISYAASTCDMNIYSKKYKNDIVKLLSRFSAISVREESVRNFLKSQYAIDSKIVLDPTLLVGRSCFENICTGRIINESYILIYQVGESSVEFESIIYELEKKYNTKKIVIISVANFVKKLNNRICYINPDVPSFLSLFKYAECVIPISFHGVAFSILFEKEFYYIKGYNADRIYTILDPLCLKKRIIDEAGVIPCDKIDYKDVNNKLEILRRESKEYLLSELMLV